VAPCVDCRQPHPPVAVAAVCAACCAAAWAGCCTCTCLAAGCSAAQPPPPHSPTLRLRRWPGWCVVAFRSASSKQQQPFPFFEDQLRDQRPARGQRSRSRKHELSARLRAINARRALFFCAFVGMPLANNISARKNSRREVGGPAQCSATASGSPAARAGDTRTHPAPTHDFVRAL
jgi:hypothetical protein